MIALPRGPGLLHGNIGMTRTIESGVTETLVGAVVTGAMKVKGGHWLVHGDMLSW